MEAYLILKGVDDDMDRQVLLRKIMRAGDEIRRLEQDIIALQSVDLVEYPQNYSSLSQQAAIRSEFIAHKLRALMYMTTNISKAAYLENVADSLGIRIIYGGDGIIEIILPCLIPHRKKGSTGFITDPLFAALARFIDKQPLDLPFQRFKHCVICITHVYDKELFGKGRERDHDNIEIKGVINVINTFLLTDDNGTLCDIYNTSALLNKDFTCITIMKKDMFQGWLSGHKNRLISMAEFA
jgi:hypothetical protein